MEPDRSMWFEVSSADAAKNITRTKFWLLAPECRRHQSYYRFHGMACLSRWSVKCLRLAETGSGSDVQIDLSVI